ncbi:MAG: holo-ACP synthase [Anaerolineae bacterium]|nr:holo-ACP synthase [Anaerolineae bacterium]
MKIASGIDLVEIERFRQLKPEILKRFFERVYTSAEREHIGASFERAAGLFAAKEALVKALGCGIGPVGWQEVEIRHQGEGNPVASLHGRAANLAQEMGILDISLSISHTREHATAVAVAIMEERGA